MGAHRVTATAPFKEPLRPQRVAQRGLIAWAQEEGLMRRLQRVGGEVARCGRVWIRV